MRTLRNRLDDGVFAVPKLQREFVWNGRKAAELMDSISRNMPIGSLMIWEAPRKAQYILRKTLHVLPAFQKHNRHIWFLIDGQQRLSVLHQAFRGETKQTSRRKVVDFSKVCLRVGPASDGDAEGLFQYRKPIEGYVSVCDVLASNWKRKLRGLAKHKRSRAEAFRKAFLGYRVPVVFVESNDLEEVRELFVRINSLGTPIASADRAFARSAVLDLRELAWETLHELPEGFRSLSYEVLLQTLALSEGVADVGRRAYESVVRKWEKEAARSAPRKAALLHRWERLSKATGKAADYLQETFKVTGADQLPSGYMLALLAIFFQNHRSAPSSRQAAEIRKWFWATGLGQRYSGRGFRQNIALDTEFFTRLAKRGNAHFRLSERIDPAELRRAEYQRRSAQSDTFFTLLRLRKPAYITNGQPVPSARYTSRANRKDRHHIFPQGLLRRKGIAVRHANSLCNICFVVAEENQGIGSKHPSVYLAPYRRRRHFSRAMRSHAIPYSRESGLWDSNVRRGFKRFLGQRLQLICRELEREAGLKLFRKE